MITMKIERIGNRRIKVFHSREELKWYFHEKMCEGDRSAFYNMERAVTEKDINKWLEWMGMRVKMLDEWLAEIEKIPKDVTGSWEKAQELPKWVYHIWQYGLIRKVKSKHGTLPEWWLFEKDIKGGILSNGSN